jgi:hypothetical protein
VFGEGLGPERADSVGGFMSDQSPSNVALSLAYPCS